MSQEKNQKIINIPKDIRLYERVSDVYDFCRTIEKHGDRILFTYFDKKRQLHDITYVEFTRKVSALPHPSPLKDLRASASPSSARPL